MSFMKYAKASVVKTNMSFDDWGTLFNAQGVRISHKKRNASVVLEKYNPEEFLLTHCTIIASVDTEDASEPLGNHIVDSFQVDRKYNDWLIKPETSEFVNNNFDCWERRLLAKTFHTFIGSDNFVEHIQIPELSKGKIIDAAARDVGPSIYIDILVATSRKHTALVQAITSKKLKTLSMGCTTTYTICSKCGNVAYDETQLCPHIRYMKGNEWIDGMGVKRKIAELCGHYTDPDSVKFIEASWVKNPAFKGAVLRNILSPEDAKTMGIKLANAFSMPSKITDLKGKTAKVAKLRKAQDFGEEMTETPPTEEPKEEVDPLEGAINSITDMIREKALEKVQKDLNKNEVQVIEENKNNSLVKEALKHASWRRIARNVLTLSKGNKVQTKRLLVGLVLYKNGGWKNVQASSCGYTGREILAISRVLDILNQKVSMAGEARIYKTVVATQGFNRYSNVDSYLTACRQVIGRGLTDTEKSALIYKGHLFSLGSR